MKAHRLVSEHGQHFFADFHQRFFIIDQQDRFSLPAGNRFKRNRGWGDAALAR